MANTHDVGDEYCPSCGEWKPLIEDTGWCLQCTRRHQPGVLVCESCERVYHTNTPRNRNVCSRCYEVAWQKRNADTIERFMACGLTFELAYIRVQINSRPICYGCGHRIKHGTKGIHIFCRSTTFCRKAARAYRWQRDRYGLSQEEALAKVLQALAKESA